jgi:hypothetical protein
MKARDGVKLQRQDTGWNEDAWWTEKGAVQETCWLHVHRSLGGHIQEKKTKGPALLPHLLPILWARTGHLLA